MADANNPGNRKEPFGAYYFQVDLHIGDQSGSEAYLFRSCSGLKSESTVVELEEGGFNTTTRKLIGRTKFPNIVLKQGFCAPVSTLWKLRQRFLNDRASGDVKNDRGWRGPNRFSGTIKQLGPKTNDNKDGVWAKWAFVGGWICKWEGPDFDASKNEISIETIEIAHEGLHLLGEKTK